MTKEDIKIKEKRLKNGDIIIEGVIDQFHLKHHISKISLKYSKIDIKHYAKERIKEELWVYYTAYLKKGSGIKIDNS